MSLAQLCRCFGISRWSLYYRPKGRKRAVDPAKAAEVKAVIERFSAYGYRRIAVVLGWNRTVVQRICQRKDWQMNKRPQGRRPWARALSSVTEPSRPALGHGPDPSLVWQGPLVHLGAGTGLLHAGGTGLEPGPTR